MRRSACLLVLLALPMAGWAQDTADGRLLRAIYAWEAPGVTGALRIANTTAYPAFALVPLGVLASEGGHAPALRVATAEGGAALLALGLKRLVRRERPYAREPGIVLRTDRLDQAVLAHDGFSMPSGHATLAFAAATAWTLERPTWYVTVPAYTWATLVGVSRVWHGAHYPSDVVAGGLLGAAVAVLVHVAWPEGEDAPEVSVPMPLVVRLAF